MAGTAAPREENDANDEETPLLGSFKDRQSQVLPRKQLLIVFPALALVQFTSFLDQTAISTSLPAIASGLRTGSSISWVGASFLTTSTSIQLINGRLSDIFGRKACLITALTIMGLGNLLSGLSQTPGQLYATRAFSGFGAGAINALIQIAISDITTLEQRGNYLGIIGVAVALGNGLGPVVGGWFTEKTSWRWAFWFICPLTVVAVIGLVFVLPTSVPTDNVLKKLRMVDWLGVTTSMAAIVLMLIPISQGGSAVAWDSPIIIAMLVTGILLFAAFIIAEWKLVKLPILPMRLFQYSRSTNALLAMNIGIGWVYWGNLFYIPLYFQNVRGCSPALAGSLILPIVVAHGAASGLNGMIISYLGRYTPIIYGGAFLWAIGAAGKTLYTQDTPIWAFFAGGILEGLGVGCAMQPLLVGLLAGSDNADRAVITGLRNFIRDIGGAVGVTVSGAILNNILQNGLKGRFSSSLISQLTSSAFALADLDLSDEDKPLISDSYMNGLHAVFVTYAVITAVLFITAICLTDFGLAGRNSQSKRASSDDESREDGVRVNGDSTD